MSYREVRNFTEMLRHLGYPDKVSVEAFRYPNFVAVADILVWLVRAYDAHAVIPTDIETVSDREMFLTAVVSWVYKETRLKMNPRKLLCGDGYAVKEMLKLASVLYKASRVVAKSGGNALAGMGLPPPPAALADNLKKTRGLASELTQLSAELFALLEKEEELRAARSSAIEQNLDMDALRSAIRAAAAAAKKKTDAIAERFKSLSSDEEILRGKIAKKRDELERKGRRLEDLADQRPAYMDEFERLETELRDRYEIYAERHRNLAFLERELDAYQLEDAEQFDKAAKSLAQLRARLQEENEARLLGDESLDDDDYDDDPPARAPRASAAPMSPPEVKGSLAGGDSSSSSSSSSSDADDEDSDF